MEITFHGSAGTVTGACFQIKSKDVNILVDCGYFQGSREEEDMNWEPFSFDPSKIDYLFLTHAHLDHCGLIPKLVRHGFSGKIICTDVTRDLAILVIKDAFKVMYEDYERGRLNYADGSKKNLLYREVDIEETIEKFEVFSYSKSIKLNDSLEFRMRNAGHILGSSIFEIWITEDGKSTKFVFSGDLGQHGKRIVWDPDNIRDADYVIVESTYGNRIHKDKNQSILEFLSLVKLAEHKKGNVLIPVFAIERTQEVLYELNLMVESGLITGIPVFLDSPLAVKVTDVFKRYPQYYDTDASRLLEQGDDPFSFKGLSMVESVEDSRKLANMKGIIILAGSGMCTGGRIVNHLLNNIEDSNCHIVFVGYQVNGTLGRKLIDGVKKVTIMGQERMVKAQIHTIGGLSAHADQKDLLYWISSFGSTPKKIFLVHGEPESSSVLADEIRKESSLEVEIPLIGNSYSL